MSNTALPSRLRIGSLIVLMGGLVPFLSLPSCSWLTSGAKRIPPSLGFPVKSCLTRSRIRSTTFRAFNPEVATDFVTAQHIELVNVMNSGSWWRCWPGSDCAVISAGRGTRAVYGAVAGLNDARRCWPRTSPRRLSWVPSLSCLDYGWRTSRCSRARPVDAETPRGLDRSS